MFLDEASHHVGSETQSLMTELRENYDDENTLRQMERNLNLRYDLMASHISHGSIQQLKDIFYLDIALESYARQLTEKAMHIPKSFHEYSQEISMILNHLCLSYQWIELQYCLNDWN